MLKGMLGLLLFDGYIAGHSFRLKSPFFEDIQRNLVSVEVYMHEPCFIPQYLSETTTPHFSTNDSMPSASANSYTSSIIGSHTSNIC